MGMVGTGALGGSLLGAGVAARPARSAPGQEIVGSWIGTGSISGTLLYTFTADGGTIGASAQHLGRSPVHGAWVRTGERRFVGVSIFLRFDAAGTVIGYARTRSEFAVDATGNSLDTTGVRQLFDIDGALQETITATSSFTRITAE